MAAGKWIDGLKAATPLDDAARLVLGLRLEAVRDGVGLALDESDREPEHVHQLRVGTRRANAALRIFVACLPRKAQQRARKRLRRLRQVAGVVRDADVFLAGLSAEAPDFGERERPAFDYLLGHTLAERTAAQAHLAEACPDHPFNLERLLAETVAAVHRPANGPRTLVELALPELTALVRDLHRAGARDLSDYDALHKVRIAGKRLRYAMEVFAGCFAPPFREQLYPQVEEMQEILGRANDSHVARQRLRLVRDQVQTLLPAEWDRLRPGMEALINLHKERLPREREQFLACWERWQQAGGEAAIVALLEAPTVPAS